MDDTVMPRLIEASVMDICNCWASVAVQDYRQQLSTIDSVVARRLGISVTTVRTHRKREEGRLLDYVFQQRSLHLRNFKHRRFPYRRLGDLPDEYVRAFESLVRGGSAPTVAYAAVAEVAQSNGQLIPSLGTFLRRSRSG